MRSNRPPSAPDASSPRRRFGEGSTLRRSWAFSVVLHGTLGLGLALAAGASVVSRMGNGPARVLVTELRTAQTATPLDVRAGAEIPGVEVCPERSWLPPTPRLPEPPLPTAPPDLEMPPTPEREGLVLHPQPSLSAAERPRPRPPQEHPRPPSSSPPSAAPAAPRPTPLELVYAPRVADFYPRAAERRGLGGVVLVGLEVDAWGAVSRAWVIASSGHVILDRAALRLVQAYRFNTASGTRRAHQRVIFTP